MPPASCATQTFGADPDCSNAGAPQLWCQLVKRVPAAVVDERDGRGSPGPATSAHSLSPCVCGHWRSCDGVASSGDMAIVPQPRKKPRWSYETIGDSAFRALAIDRKRTNWTDTLGIRDPLRGRQGRWLGLIVPTAALWILGPGDRTIEEARDPANRSRH